jgi:hypothetical protein
MPRALRLILLSALGLVVLALAALGASAVLDRPAKVVTTSSVVEAPKPVVWDVLTDFDAYEEWNPVFRKASGKAEEGSSLELDATFPGHGSERLDAEVLIVRDDRKLRWQDRLVAPGVRDWEYEFVLQPVEPGRVVVVQVLRAEGLLAPFADDGAAREALGLIGEALARRVEQRG